MAGISYFDYDRYLGTAVRILAQNGHTEAVSVLLDANLMEFRYLSFEDTLDFGAGWFPAECVTTDLEAVIELPPEQLAAINDEEFAYDDNKIKEALDTVLQRTGNNVIRICLVPSLAEGTWRQEIAYRMAGEDRPESPVDEKVVDGFFFDRDSEIAVYGELKLIQQKLPEHDNIVIVANPWVRIGNKPRRPDFLVTYRKKVAAIEVDGGSHIGRRDEDNLRDRMFEQSGVAFMWHISEDDAFHPVKRQEFVKNFMRRLRDI